MAKRLANNIGPQPSADRTQKKKTSNPYVDLEAVEDNQEDHDGTLSELSEDPNDGTVDSMEDFIAADDEEVTQQPVDTESFVVLPSKASQDDIRGTASESSSPSLRVRKRVRRSKDRVATSDKEDASSLTPGDKWIVFIVLSLTAFPPYVDAPTSTLIGMCRHAAIFGYLRLRRVDHGPSAPLIDMGLPASTL
ncbi:hypothetical protein B0H14DRAFT_3432363 [Mycena olivaceomarginata]|nr:hypothetical protein B0H14DRAFT_3432363 [Mycena olivaceomarginata]